MEEDIQDWVKRFGETVNWVENELGIPNGFITDLIREDDWSFIIKVHALVEAAVTNQLSSSIDPRLSPVFEQLELSDSRKGKIVFAKTLGLLDQNQRKFVRFLSELRNGLVHNVRKVSFTIHAYVSNLDTNQRDSFIDSITYFASNNHRTGWRSEAIKSPKSTILAATLMLLVYTTVRADTEKKKRELVFKKAKLLDDAFGDSDAQQK